LLLELHLDLVLAAAAVEEVDSDLHYPVADLNQAVVLGSADHQVDWADLGPHSHYLLH
jgi:hypothetical protein